MKVTILLLALLCAGCSEPDPTVRVSAKCFAVALEKPKHEGIGECVDRYPQQALFLAHFLTARADAILSSEGLLHLGFFELDSVERAEAVPPMPNGGTSEPTP